MLRSAIPCALLTALAACASSARPPDPWRARPATGDTWRLPEGWKTEVIPFPLGFAPTLALSGVEELRFPPGFFDAAAPDYWSYAFAWRLDAPARLAPAGLADALVTYFRGLTAAVDADRQRIADTSATRADARPLPGGDLALDVTTHDAFTTGELVHLTGRARRVDCGAGRELWVVGLVHDRAPPEVREAIAALSGEAACGQAPVEPPPKGEAGDGG